MRFSHFTESSEIHSEQRSRFHNESPFFFFFFTSQSSATFTALKYLTLQVVPLKAMRETTGTLKREGKTYCIFQGKRLRVHTDQFSICHQSCNAMYYTAQHLEFCHFLWVYFYIFPDPTTAPVCLMILVFLLLHDVFLQTEFTARTEAWRKGHNIGEL